MVVVLFMKVLIEVSFHPHTSVVFVSSVKEGCICVYVLLFLKFLLDMFWVYIDLFRKLPDSVLSRSRNYRILTFFILQLY